MGATRKFARMALRKLEFKWGSSMLGGEGEGNLSHFHVRRSCRRQCIGPEAGGGRGFSSSLGEGFKSNIHRLGGSYR